MAISFFDRKKQKYFTVTIPKKLAREMSVGKVERPSSVPAKTAGELDTDFTLKTDPDTSEEVLLAGDADSRAPKDPEAIL